MKKAANTTNRSLTLVMILAGAVAMGWLAVSYITWVNSIDKKGSEQIWGLLELQRQELSPLWRVIVFTAFVFLGMFLGIALSKPISNLKRRIESMSAQEKVGNLVGLLLGLGITALLLVVIQTKQWPAKIAIAVVVCYVCVVAITSAMEQFRIVFSSQPKDDHRSSGLSLRPKILDTNVIIDGRIADVCKAGFVEGPILIPKFVLEELQQIADSSDPLKRARGRRGLDILNNMQKELQMQVQTVDSEPIRAGEDVDSRLIRMAQETGASVITNDFNLNKVAALQGVQVLNVNELANALKPVVLPGEEMAVAIIKEGKETNQGIGYMDDGTMIVVEGGKRRIGETLDVIVTSVLQTVAGKMIFANIKTEQENEEESFERNVRSYTSSRQRKKIR